jgi:hypothetical protein
VFVASVASLLCNSDAITVADSTKWTKDVIKQVNSSKVPNTVRVEEEASKQLINVECKRTGEDALLLGLEEINAQ